MVPSIPSARLRLSYPLQCTDFDPNNPDFLIVGGGGGYGSSGVPNKISLIDASRRHDLTEVVDIELPRGVDSVQSIGVAASNAEVLVAFAGINSPLPNRKAGQNEHFRSFKISLPPKKPTSEVTETSQPLPGKTEVIGSAQLFAPSLETLSYQRRLRLSPLTARRPERMVAIANVDAFDNEVLVLKAEANPAGPDILTKIRLGKVEAEDVDFTWDDVEAEHNLAYCTNDKVYLQRVSNVEKITVSTPAAIYETPESATNVAASERPKIRALRFLTPLHLLVLQNKSKAAGVELLILRLSQDHSKGHVRLQKRLSKSTKAAVGMDVCVLTESAVGEKQIIIAVATQDSSIELLTLEYSPLKGMTTFRTYKTLNKVHSMLTQLRFSNFIGPRTPVTSEVGPQSVKLASVGVDNCVVVHTLPLRPHPPVNSRAPRYVLTRPGRSESYDTAFSVFMAVFTIGLMAFLMQSFIEIRGGAPPTIGVTEWLPLRVKEAIAKPYMFAEQPVIASVMPPVISATSRIQSAIPDLPGVETATDMIKDAASDLPSVESATNMAKDAIPDMSSVETATSIIIHGASDKFSVETVTSLIHHVASDLSSVGSATDRIKHAASDLPDVESATGMIKSAASDLPSVETATEKLRDLVRQQLGQETPKAIVMLDRGKKELLAELHREADVVGGKAVKKWDELSEREKKGWKKRLSDAGQWSANHGESVLTGIFFSELAGAVGGVVRGN